MWHPNSLHLSAPVSVTVSGIAIKLVVVLSDRVSLTVSRAFLALVVAGDRSSRSQRFLLAVSFLCTTRSWSQLGEFQQIFLFFLFCFVAVFDFVAANINELVSLLLKIIIDMNLLLIMNLE
ncbi:hypothetical protein S245_060772 [Arachis hypogaea]